jgi:hypothetical protein
MGAMKRNYRSESVTRVLGTDEWRPRVDAGEPLGTVFRETLQEQFRRLKYLVPEHKEIRVAGSNTPVYDLVFASRHSTGVDFWKKILKIGPYGERQLELT